MRKGTAITLLILIFLLAIFLRVYFAYPIVISDHIKYFADDAVYHMRLVENMLLGGHPFQRIFFDPYTNFPHGSYSYWAPLSDYILAAIIWVISFGKPTLAVINQVAPFYPVLISSLLVFVVYFIAMGLWKNRKIALLASFLYSIFPTFIFKSLLGANDHHIVEILFSSLTILFLLYALRQVKSRRFWLFVVLSGISLGLYFLSWSGAVIFLFILFSFFVIYYLLEYFSGKNSRWILLVGSLIFLIALAMIIPFLGHPNIFLGRIYNIQHLLCFVFSFLVFGILAFLEFVFKKKSIQKKFFIPALFSILIIGVVLLRLISPSLFNSVLGLLGGVNVGVTANSAAREVISEMSPLSWDGSIGNFGSYFLFFLLGFFIILYKFIKKPNPFYLLLLVWGFVVAIISGVLPFIGQNRFSLYLGVVVALISSFIIIRGFGMGWNSLRSASRLEKTNPFRFNLLIGSGSLLLGLTFLILYPLPFNLTYEFPASMPSTIQSVISGVKNPFILSEDWYKTLDWVRENTPDPGLDYYALYKEPGIGSYSYPVESYGILSPWMYGHDITYYSHRMVVANPFQEGIGKKENGQVKELGEGVFFLETNESKAIVYLDQLRVKYIITDYGFASKDMGLFKNTVKWVQGDLGDYLKDPSLFDNSMVVRLHLLDGAGIDIENVHTEPLSHFRLVYESDTSVASMTGSDEENIKQVKVFEYVKGAEINGYGITKVSTEVTTNQDRKFTYSQNSGFVVPYPGLYTVSFNGFSIKVNITEKQIEEGLIINI